MKVHQTSLPSTSKNDAFHGLLIAIYLGLPIFLFLLTWFRLPVAISMAVLYALGIRMAFPLKLPLSMLLSKKKMIFILSAAIVWSSLGGAGHLFYANLDWYVRDAALLDLSSTMGPLAYQASGDPVISLARFPLGYYLAPAIIEYITGFHNPSVILLLWTIAGIFLFFLLLASQFSSWKSLFLLVVVTPLFAGMDWVGDSLVSNQFQSIFSSSHLQWWARFFQYSSNSTLLFWAPNHALPGWLFAAFFYLNWDNAKQLRTVPFWLATLPLWSPLTAIGGIPFLAIYLWRHRQAYDQLWIMFKTGCLFVLPAMICAFYLMMDTKGIQGHLLVFNNHFIRVYLVFVILEFAMLWLLLCYLKNDSRLMVAGVILFFLPLFSLGPGNDLVMRSSIIALMILYLSCIERLSQATVYFKKEKAAVMAIFIILGLGAITPAHEIMRALKEPSWQTSPHITLYVAASGAKHYFAQHPNPLIGYLLAPARVKHVDIDQR